MDKAQDAEKLIAWVREAAYELENAHRVLDDEGIPREEFRSRAALTLAGRIHVLTQERPSCPSTKG